MVYGAPEAPLFYYVDADVITPQRAESTSQHVVSYLYVNALITAGPCSVTPTESLYISDSGC